MYFLLHLCSGDPSIRWKKNNCVDILVLEIGHSELNNIGKSSIMLPLQPLITGCMFLSVELLEASDIEY